MTLFLKKIFFFNLFLFSPINIQVTLSVSYFRATLSASYFRVTLSALHLGAGILYPPKFYHFAPKYAPKSKNFQNQPPNTPNISNMTILAFQSISGAIPSGSSSLITTSHLHIYFLKPIVVVKLDFFLFLP